jgi:4,5-dihydroxyphthalate decarboxylase
MFAAARPRGSAEDGRRDVLPLGRAALEPAMDLAMRYAAAQGLLPRRLDPAEIWEGLPPDIA